METTTPKGPKAASQEPMAAVDDAKPSIEPQQEVQSTKEPLVTKPPPATLQDSGSKNDATKEEISKRENKDPKSAVAQPAEESSPVVESKNAEAASSEMLSSSESESESSVTEGMASMNLESKKEQSSERKTSSSKENSPKKRKSPKSRKTRLTPAMAGASSLIDVDEAMDHAALSSDKTKAPSPPVSPVKNDNNNNDDQDVTSKAAVALAAVAAAASASHKSPAQAAKQARAVAVSWIGDATDDTTSGAGGWKNISSSAMAELESTMNTKFVQTLLLMERYRTEPPTPETGVPVPEVVNEAKERLETVLRKVEGAYDSLFDLIPQEQRMATPVSPDDSFGDETVVTPDLLPPCYNPSDPTLAFFRACRGNGEPLPPLPTEVPTPALEPPSAATTTPASTSLFTSMFRKNTASLFRNRRSPARNSNDESVSDTASQATETSVPSVQESSSDCYTVTIEKDLLGLTVENVLERTVVRTVAPSGAAKRAGAQVGSLLVKVGNTETIHLTHFETIDELRQSNRPLHLILRKVSDDSLRMAREEMGRLIKGSGFGTLLQQDGNGRNANDGSGPTDGPLIEADLRVDAYTSMVRRRLAEARPPIKNKKDEALARVGDKLIWILTLFVIGLEREAKEQEEIEKQSTSLGRPRGGHTAKEYSDAAKSVSKILFDYMRKKLDPQASLNNSQKARSNNFIQSVVGKKGRKGQLPPPPNRAGRGGRGGFNNPGDSLPHEKPLLQIGDVLQRTRTFLADTNSRPAAMLRGELISFLCDLLDVDTGMELLEDEIGPGGDSRARGALTDLGSAGGLLKLIVLNCPIMRSPTCSECLNEDNLDDGGEDEYGARDEMSALDKHRLHAGNRFLSIVHRLAASRSTGARITACSLGPVLWGHLDFPHQLQLRGVITRALHDVDVMVRKATAAVLHEIAELVFDARSVPWLVLMCERAMTDPEPQLRSAAMTLTWHLAEHLPNAFLGDASQGSRYLRRLPNRDDPTFAEVYLLQCKLLPVATRLAEDRSPSVRLSVAAQCDRLCDALGAHWSSVVIDTLLALLSDADEGVRCEAVSCVARLSDIVLLSATPGEAAPSEVSVLEALIPASVKLQTDKSVSVRVALAATAGDLLSLLVALQSRAGESHEEKTSEENWSYKRHVDERLVPMVQTLLNDSDPEVASSALRAVTNATRSSLHQTRARKMSITSEDDSASLSSYASQASRERPVFHPVLSEKQVLKLLPTLTELGSSKQWRVRQSAVEIVPALLGCTQKMGTRAEIAKLCVALMNDKVDAVRKTAAECLCMGGSSLGSHGEGTSAEWISSIVVPNIRNAAIHGKAKQRLLSLKMVEVVLLSGACPTAWHGNEGVAARLTDSPIRELAAIALSLTTDKIANVRLNVGRTLENVLHVFEDRELSFIREVLNVQLQQEQEGAADRDVLYFAKRCKQKATVMMSDRKMGRTEC